jgi:nucleosome binding factor SPN SPT16 subunit
MLRRHILFNFSDTKLLHYGGSSIVCAFGIRYKSYCSYLVRTLLVNPSEEIKSTYKFLIECEEIILNELKHGRIYFLVVFLILYHFYLRCTIMRCI